MNFAKLNDVQEILMDAVGDGVAINLKTQFNNYTVQYYGIEFPMGSNEIIGYIYGYVRSDNCIKIELESYIDSLFVEENYRYQKVGTTLLNLFVEESRRRNVKYILIDNKQANKHAKEVYEKLGFNIFIESRRKEI